MSQLENRQACLGCLTAHQLLQVALLLLSLLRPCSCLKRAEELLPQLLLSWISPLSRTGRRTTTTWRAKRMAARTPATARRTDTGPLSSRRPMSTARLADPVDMALAAYATSASTPASAKPATVEQTAMTTRVHRRLPTSGESRAMVFWIRPSQPCSATAEEDASLFMWTTGTSSSGQFPRDDPPERDGPPVGV